MSNMIIATSAALVSGVSLWGWGSAARGCARLPSAPPALTVALGLAVVVFIGGVLNFARMVHTWSLDGIVIIGLAFAAVGWRRANFRITKPSAGTLLAMIPILVAGWFIASHLMPQLAYNAHDDFEKYFPHPIKMLATGALSPSPLGSLGAETLGGQALLHAFVAGHFPLVYIGAVDNFFCLLLCVTLAGFAVKPRPWALGAIAAELSVLTINPQMVNCSSLFSGTALIMAVIFITGLPCSSGQKTPSALLLGLLYAGLIALKSLFVTFVGLHFLVLFFLIEGGWQHRFKHAFLVGAWTCLFIAPWALIHLPVYVSPSIPDAPPTGEFTEPLNYFSSEPLFYGATHLHYTGLALAGLLAAIVLFFLRRRGALSSPSAANAMITAGLSGGVAYFVMIGLLGPILYGREAALRYLCPIVIGTIPAIIAQAQTVTESRSLRFLPLAATCLGFASIAAFLPSTMTRISLIKDHGVPFSHLAQNHESRSLQELLDYNRDVFAGPQHAKLAAIQALVPAGEPLGVWVMTPFHLEFSRNPIVNADHAGLGMRWARLPENVHYFLVEHQGRAVRSEQVYISQATGPGRLNRIQGHRALAFLNSLKDRIKTSELLYADDSYFLMKFQQP